MKANARPYDILLLDLDDTLLDFKAAERNALARLFGALGHPLTDPVRNAYQKLNRSLWAACEKGEMERDDVLNTRFSRLFASLGKEEDGAGAEKIYRKALGEDATFMPDAFPVCEALFKEYPLYVATNGVRKTQEERLALSGLGALMQGLFVSETIGHMKPAPEFFNAVFAALPEITPDRMLIIGDSLSSDMRGGHDAGIATCWFNPAKLPNHGGIPVDHEIASLRELLPLLLP